jgi:hypothetical protein
LGSQVDQFGCGACMQSQFINNGDFGSNHQTLYIYFRGNTFIRSDYTNFSQ